MVPSQDIAQLRANRLSQASLSIAQNNYDRFKRLHDDSVINDVKFLVWNSIGHEKLSRKVKKN